MVWSKSRESSPDKVRKYSPMSRDFYMVPICVETTGVWGPSGYKFIKELGRLTSEKTKEKRSTSFIIHHAKHLNGDPTWKLCKCLMYNSQPKTVE
jgi:hypothetical protein